VRPKAAAAGQSGTRFRGQQGRQTRRRPHVGRGGRRGRCRTSGGHLPDRTGARAVGASAGAGVAV